MIQFNSLNYWIKQISGELDKILNIDEIKSLKSSFYATVYT